MNLEMFQIPSFVTIALTLSSLLILPAAAMALSKIPVAVSTKSSNTPDGTACDLPPIVDVEDKGAEYVKNEMPLMDRRPEGNIRTATFAMGWFWGPDSRYGSLDGVIRTRVGYAGGTRPNPTYRRIGDHMETIQIDYDSERTSFDRLLHLFFSGHNPTWPSPMRQYASAIFYHDDEQKHLAEKTMMDVAQKYGKKISTELLPYTDFTRAEDYHQKYYLRNTRDLMEQFKGRFTSENAFTDSTAVARVNGYIGGNGTIEQLEREESELGISTAATDALREILVKKGK